MVGQGEEALGHWLESRRGSWQEFERRLAALRGPAGDDVETVVELMGSYRALGRDLSLARRLWPEGRITRSLEALFTHAYDTLHRPPADGFQALVELFREQAPADVRALRGPIAISSLIFVVTGLMGWWLIWNYPELARLFASAEMIEEVEQGRLWTDGLLNVVPSSLLSIGIMANNITVTLTAFALGALYGVGTLYMIGLNGLMLGGIFAFTAHHGLAGRLFEFVVAHGTVELSVIALAGACGLKLGEALARPGDRSRREAFQASAAQAGRLAVVGAVFLVGCGVIEGFVSPDERFPLAIRVTIGTAYWLVFAAVLGGGLSRHRRWSGKTL